MTVIEMYDVKKRAAFHIRVSGILIQIFLRFATTIKMLFDGI